MNSRKIVFSILLIGIILISSSAIFFTTTKHSFNYEVNINDNMNITATEKIKVDGIFNYIALTKINKNNNRELQSINSDGIIITKENNKSIKLYHISTNILGGHKINLNYNINETNKTKTTLGTFYSNRPIHKVNIKSSEDFYTYKDIKTGQANIFATKYKPKEYNNFVLFNSRKENEKDFKRLDSYISESFQNFFPEKVDKKPPVVIVSKDKNISTVSETINRQLSGIYYYGVIYVKNTTKKESITAHEMSHYYIDKNMNMNLESWINEGISTYVEETYLYAKMNNYSYNECVSNNCFKKDPFINWLKLDEYYEKENTHKVIWENNTNKQLSYKYSNMIIVNYVVQNNDYYLKNELESINNGTKPINIFDIKPCEKENNKERCIQNIYSEW